MSEERLERWKKIWADLYAERLPRADHETKRDEMWSWARERGEFDVCESARQASVPFAKYDADPEIKF